MFVLFVFVAYLAMREDCTNVLCLSYFMYRIEYQVEPLIVFVFFGADSHHDFVNVIVILYVAPVEKPFKARLCAKQRVFQLDIYLATLNILTTQVLVI